MYQVSNLGNIKALKRRVDKGKCHRSWNEHILRTACDKKGYVRTNLAKNGVNKTVKVHRVVAQAFIPNTNNLPQVNHIDGDKTNNKVENLEWIDNGGNQKHAFRIGLKSNKCENNPSAKLTPKDIMFIKEKYIPRSKEFGTVALSKKFNVHRKTISRVINKQTWKCGDAECQM